MDIERDEEAVEPQGGWEWVKTQEEKLKKEREEVCVFVHKITRHLDMEYPYRFKPVRS